MTDITELAQSLKAAAENAIGAHERLAAYPYGEIIDISQQEGEQIDIDITDINEFIALANPANILALVEALEKAQQRITQMESRTVTDWIEHDGKWRPESLGLDELVYLKTRKKELKIPYPAGKVKGWMNTGGDMDVMAYKLASPQASTVTVKLTGINEYLAEVHDKTLNRALRLLAEGVRAGDVAAMRAAGIKVEVE
ncbi:ead/Ea22-like family protein [Klebsiella aerogenes]|uniref:ead/Ea22-like family protein n=1 Tax=Klebsiella aerogenes TaxID=548 RepID=UPI0015E920E5|nr:ead/Ea22-like family protein [Klebsiella aerogenes]MCT2785248.1 ead/Ea22-like family protein [Klebsiella aerogenes]MCT2805468.1 ead/Ea22-like family protein [Klebsiella aerogenes]MCT2811788.1 ead/Ea22-like family protein [Klebsiella aerogenes]MCT2848265.1 ead/Ea22-like family protein [Klebsiella aerogenes]QLS46434.1 ead/Ea22-like family protein [Klebsiella aerogenes]